MIVTNKLRVGVITGEDIYIRISYKINSMDNNISINYNAYPSSLYDEIIDGKKVKENAIKIPLTDIPAELNFPFNSQEQSPTWLLSNQLFVNWVKEKLGLKDDEITIITE